MINKFLRIPKKVFAIGFFISLILSIIAYDFSSYMDKIQVGDIADWYHTVINVFPPITKLVEFRGKWIFLVFTVIFAGLFLLRLFYKKKIFLIRHQSMAYDLAEIDSNLKKQYSFNEQTLQQVSGIHSNSIDNIVIKEIDEMAIKAQKSKNQVGYYGIAHTPLIFRLGFKIGDQSNVILLHKKRNNNALFEEWKREKSGIKIIHSQENTSKKSNELIVTVSTSLEIQKEHLRLLHPENKHILHFVSNYLDFDSVLSYDDAETLRADILLGIRETVKKYKINRIHMVISSSVAFTFFLAQGYSAQHDPEIVVYHYEHENYPWGVNINKAADTAYVQV